MTQPELFDVAELLVNVPKHQQATGAQGTVVEYYDNGDFEVEFANEDGETTILFSLLRQQFMVVWKASTKQWLSTVEKINGILGKFPESKQEEVLNYAQTIYERA